jgi:hypothetical protein
VRSAPIGAEGIVAEIGDGEYRVLFDGVVTNHPLGAWTMPYQLAPLTPPAEDAWAADAVRKVTKPEPTLLPLPVPQGDKLPSLAEVLKFYEELERPTRSNFTP